MVWITELSGLLIPRSVSASKALRGEEIKVYGVGLVVRDFIYIEDAVRAIMKIVDGEKKHHTFNVGCGYGTSIKKVLETIRDSLDVELRVNYLLGRKVDVPVNYLDISRYKKYFGVLNPITLSEDVLRTMVFMREKYLCGDSERCGTSSLHDKSNLCENNSNLYGSKCL